ncbi:uncharacterized protein LOC135391295 isoform X2 [Ornithodoros turicata]|uniref:uncharacterized protein LOC135391295 isoform X2 n=1 Tax=Ornithodoros turicata TaxID=34597 RepID=UPI0031399136
MSGSGGIPSMRPPNLPLLFLIQVLSVVSVSRTNTFNDTLFTSEADSLGLIVPRHGLPLTNCGSLPHHSLRLHPSLPYHRTWSSTSTTSAPPYPSKAIFSGSIVSGSGGIPSMRPPNLPLLFLIQVLSVVSVSRTNTFNDTLFTSEADSLGLIVPRHGLPLTNCGSLPHHSLRLHPSLPYHRTWSSTSTTSAPPYPSKAIFSGSIVSGSGGIPSMRPPNLPLLFLIQVLSVVSVSRTNTFNDTLFTSEADSLGLIVPRHGLPLTNCGSLPHHSLRLHPSLPYHRTWSSTSTTSAPPYPSKAIFSGSIVSGSGGIPSMRPPNLPLLFLIQVLSVVSVSRTNTFNDTLFTSEADSLGLIVPRHGLPLTNCGSLPHHSLRLHPSLPYHRTWSSTSTTSAPPYPSKAIFSGSIVSGSGGIPSMRPPNLPLLFLIQVLSVVSVSRTNTFNDTLFTSEADSLGLIVPRHGLPLTNCGSLPHHSLRLHPSLPYHRTWSSTSTTSAPPYPSKAIFSGSIVSGSGGIPSMRPPNLPLLFLIQG